MNCAICNEPNSIVVETRMLAHETKTRRRRECTSCGERFTTYEVYKPTVEINESDRIGCIA